MEDRALLKVGLVTGATSDASRRALRRTLQRLPCRGCRKRFSDLESNRVVCVADADCGHACGNVWDEAEFRIQVSTEFQRLTGRNSRRRWPEAVLRGLSIASASWRRQIFLSGFRPIFPRNSTHEWANPAASPIGRTGRRKMRAAICRGRLVRGGESGGKSADFWMLPGTRISV